MKLGIIADSHDNINALEYWVEYFNSEDVDVLLHAGDFISPFTVPVLNRMNAPVYGVFGNNDGDRETLKKKAKGTDVSFRESPAMLDLTECTVSMSHKPSNLPSTSVEDVDLFVHGHTHERKWDVENRSSPIANPGESGGWLSGCSSSLLVNYSNDSIEHNFHLIPAP